MLQTQVHDAHGAIASTPELAAVQVQNKHKCHVHCQVSTLMRSAVLCHVSMHAMHGRPLVPLRTQIFVTPDELLLLCCDVCDAVSKLILPRIVLYLFIISMCVYMFLFRDLWASSKSW